jgi:restriction endonuclease S subunit
MASGGTMMGTISSGYIATLKINPPPIEQQRQIGEFLRLANQEQQLLTKLMAKKRLLADTMLTRLQQL